MIKIKIGVVVVHFGKKDDTFECIRSLYKVKSKSCKVKIYLVDNDPENRINSSEIRHPNTELITTLKNLGWAGGVNIGCRKAIKDNCNYIMLLNNDTVVRNGIFEKLLAYFYQKDVGMVSPIIVYYNNPDIIWCFGGKLNQKFLFTTHPNMNKSTGSISLLNPVESNYGGTCLLVKSTVFKKIGFFDERYFLNIEDVEWCFRASKAGFRLLYAPYPLVLHKVSATSGIKGSSILSLRNAYFYARNPFIFLRDHKDSLSITLAFIGQTFISFPYYILFRTKSFRVICSYIKGYFDGLMYLLTGSLLV